MWLEIDQTPVQLTSIQEGIHKNSNGFYIHFDGIETEKLRAFFVDNALRVQLPEAEEAISLVLDPSFAATRGNCLFFTRPSSENKGQEELKKLVEMLGENVVEIRQNQLSVQVLIDMLADQQLISREQYIDRLKNALHQERLELSNKFNTD
ncbi:hypothetical protein [Aureibacillus halotolerans]|uniref:Uncharacterized protein n=1 Tax=Aureibacillus halotolerans TaxID=1508390 RepID=A0A4R6U2X4_9BACI|nr:hypothetical protein [Aureibacillus halotolerans]TDQ40351.1 hypothetical protein EV213_10667 [Aureibacillus halotolerans]